MLKTNVDYTMIGKRIKDRRKALNLTQEQVASEVDLSTFYLSKIENGKACATLETYALLASYLNIDLGYLISGASILDREYYLSKLENICKIATPKQLSLILKISKSILED